MDHQHHGRRVSRPDGGEGQAQRQTLIHADQERRILQAIAECDAYITKEGRRAADLRPASAQQHLDFCIQHKAKLVGALADPAVLDDLLQRAGGAA